MTKMLRNRILPSATMVALLCGCNPGVFSDLEDETWVDTSGVPEALSSDGYGSALVFSGTSGSGTTLTVLGQRPAGAALLTYGDDGGQSVQTRLLDDVLRGIENLADKPAIAAAPEVFGEAAGNVAIGAVVGGAPHAVLLAGGDFSFPDPIQLAASGGAPLALAFGLTDSDKSTGELDLIALLDGQLVITPDYMVGADAPVVCELAGGRALVTADLDDVSGGDEIVVSTPAGLQVVLGSEIEAGACAGTMWAEAPEGEGDFGARLASGDFDGDGAADIVASAPESGAVYIYLSSYVEQPVVLTGPSGSVSFGEALAVGDLDGDGVDDLVVGDSGYSGEVSGGGAAHIYRFGTGSFEEPITLFDSDPEAQQRFGQAVAIAAFSDRGNLLAVGASDEVFTYFQLPLAGSEDLRR